MTKILLTAASYLLMIVFGYMFKRLGLVKQQDGKALAQLVLKFTLPAAIVSSFATFTVDYSLLIIILIGFLANTTQVVSGILISRKKSREDKIFFVADCGFNIGNFTLPFTSSFLGPLGIVTTSLFDCGNAIMLLGFDYTITETVANGKIEKSGIRRMFKTLFTTPAFDAYLIMMAIVLPGGKIPSFITTIAGEIARANGPMAMLMIGIMMEINFSRHYVKDASLLIGVRICIALFYSFVFSKMTFLPYEVMKAAIMVCWSPIASAAPAYVALLNGDERLSSFTSTISILISIVVITCLAIFL